MSAYTYTTQDIAEALLREFLVRTRCTATLETFNQERPKHANSISKREALHQALGVVQLVEQAKKEAPPQADGGLAAQLPSTLELWVASQMSRQSASNNFFEPTAAEMAAEKAKAAARSSRRSVVAEEEPEDVSVPENGSNSTYSRHGPVHSTRSSTTALPRSSPSPPAGSPQPPSGSAPGSGSFHRSTSGSRPSGPPVPLSGAFGMTSPQTVQVSSNGSSKHSSAVATNGVTAGEFNGRPKARRPAVNVLNSDSDDEPEVIPASRHARSDPTRTSAPTFAPPRHMQTPSQPPPTQQLGQSGHSRSSAVAPPPRATAATAGRNFSSGYDGDTGGGAGTGLVMEDVEESFETLVMETPLQSSQGLGMRGGSGARAMSKGIPVSQDLVRSMKALLWGSQGLPPPSWKQGFFFNRHKGVEFGLVQKEGGPCGVLAAVQAHILAALQAQDGSFTLSPTPSQQQQALATAISESLWAARPTSSAPAVLVLPTDEARGSSQGSEGYDQLARAIAAHSATSPADLQDMVSASLHHFSDGSGWGIILLLMSLLMTRGVSTVQSDMDEPGNALLGMHGYCTQELVNLILTGSAASNVFDGVRDLDGCTTLRGVTKPCKLGLLTLFEWYKYVEVGDFLKRPQLPVWVVCSESHFTVLFRRRSPQGSQLHMQSASEVAEPFDLMFYDELANMEAPIRLTISADPGGGWTGKMGDTIGDRGKCEGQNIPPLECVIETRWPGVRVNWNGSDPIL